MVCSFIKARLKMIVRLRTNLGVTRLDVDGANTIADLQRLVIQSLHIAGSANDLTLAEDLTGTRQYNDTEISLEQAGIGHGSEIFVLGKFEKRVVEKAFIGEDGVLVPAGQTLIRIDAVDAAVASTASLKQENEPSHSVESYGALAGAPATVSISPRPSPAVDPTAAIEAPQEPSAVPPSSHWMDDSLLEEQEDDLRAPDPVRQVNLLGEASVVSYDRNNTETGNSLMQAVLLPEEQEQINQLEQALREAGLREYDVYLETQQLQDQLIAERLQREVAAHSMTHDALTAALLAQHSADTAIHSHLDKIDATLARYHQQQRHSAAPDVLRLQQFQGVKNKAAVVNSGTMTRNAAGDKGSSVGGSAAVAGNRGAMRNNDQPVIKSKACAATTSAAGIVQTTTKPAVKPTPPVKPVKPSAITPVAPVMDRIHTTGGATHSAIPARNLSTSNANAGTANPNTKHSADVSTHASANTSTNTSVNTAKPIKGRNPSKLLTDAMRNLEAVAIDLPSVNDVITSHHASHPVSTNSTPTHSADATSTSAKVARPSPFQQTALRSLTAPSAMPLTSGNAMMDSDPGSHSANTTYRPSTFRPTSHYATDAVDTTHREFDSSDILNEEDDEVLLALLSPSRHISTGTVPSSSAERKVQTNPPSARAAVPNTDRVHSDPALSLLGSGYKSMSQIKHEQREQNTAVQPPAQKPKATRSSRTSQLPTSTISSTATTTNSKAATTAKSDRYSTEGTTNKADMDVMDETLALALQLSLEHHAAAADTTKINNPVTTKPKRVKKETVTAAATPSIQPSSQLKKNLFTRLPPSTSTGKAAERRQLQQRALEKQVLEDAHRQLENDRRAAEDLQVQLNREAESAMLRQHLFAHEHSSSRPTAGSTGDSKVPVKALPSWLQHKVDDSANEALMDLAAQQSFMYDQHRAQQHQQQKQQQQQQSQPAVAAMPRRMPERPAYTAPAPAPNPLPAPVPAPQPVPVLRAPLNRPYLGQGAPQNNSNNAQQVQRPYAGGVVRERDQNDIFRLLDNNNAGRDNNMVNNAYDPNYMNVVYDEDDEMLARAIQESLNDGLY